MGTSKTQNLEIGNSTPLGMVCEYNDCKKTNGRDHKRPKDMAEKGWEDEPIFLCETHAIELKAIPL